MTVRQLQDNLQRLENRLDLEIQRVDEKNAEILRLRGEIQILTAQALKEKAQKRFDDFKRATDL